MVKGLSDYYIVKDDETGKYAIFDKNGERVSDWYDEIMEVGLIKGQSEYLRKLREAIIMKGKVLDASILDVKVGVKKTEEISLKF